MQTQQRRMDAFKQGHGDRGVDQDSKDKDRGSEKGKCSIEPTALPTIKPTGKRNQQINQ